MKAKIKVMHIEFVCTMERDGEWVAMKMVHEVPGYDGKVTRAAAERALAQMHDGSPNMFYNILTVETKIAVIEVHN